MEEIAKCFVESIKNKVTYGISLKKAYEWLELKLSEDIKQTVLNEYLRNEDYNFIEAEGVHHNTAHFIIKKTPLDSSLWFSIEGFKMFCVVSRSPKAQDIMRHIDECERNYEKNLKESVEKTAKEIRDLKNRKKNTVGKIIKISYERDELLISSDFYKKENDKLKLGF